MRNGNSFDDVASQKKFRTYYRSITTSDRYIYLLNAEGIEENYPAYSHMIYAMDWEGNPVTRLKMPSLVEHIFLDAENNLLYGQDDNDNYYCYDLSKCGLF